MQLVYLCALHFQALLEDVAGRRLEHILILGRII